MSSIKAGRVVATGGVRSLFVVFPSPLFQSCLQMLHVVKDFTIQQFSTKAGVEVFHIAVFPQWPIQAQRIITVNRIILVKIRPIFFQRIAVARNDIVRQNAAHDEVHAGKVVRVFLELLHGNNLDEIDQVSNGLGTRAGSVPPAARQS